MVLAFRLGNQDFKQWVEWELNGYPSNDVLPSYRVLRVESHGQFVGPFQSGIKNALLPPSCLPESNQQLANTAHLVESVTAYSCLIKDSNSTLQIPWPADAVVAFGGDFYENMTCVRAWRVLSRGALAAVINTVRNRVLSFALDLEAENPFAGELLANGTVRAKERVAHMFNQQIRHAKKVFLGHGRSHVRKDLRHFLTDRLRLECDDFNREPVAGRSTKELLQEMVESAAIAFLVMTGEDEQSDNTVRARENVVHEVGLLQGRLGFEKAIILLEDGCSPFSNIDGLTYIRFPKGAIEAVSEEIRREGILRQ